MFKFSKTSHAHKIVNYSKSALLIIYGEVGQGMKVLRGGGGVGKESRKWEYPLVECDMG